MNVSLIHFTGAPDPLFAARLMVYTKSTRLEQGADTRAKFMAMSEEELKPHLEYMANTLRTSWEFVDYTFEIKDVTRAFTHQFVRTRTGTYAQQAQRVVDMSSFGYMTPDSFEPDLDESDDDPNRQEKLEIYQDTMAVIASSYEKLIQLGAAKQDARGLLPTNVHTNIIAKFNLRTMADLAGKRDNARAQGEYVDVYRAMAKEVLRVHPWAHAFLYPERLATPSLDKLLLASLGDKSPIDCPEINDALKELDKLKASWG